MISSLLMIASSDKFKLPKGSPCIQSVPALYNIKLGSNDLTDSSTTELTCDR